MDASATPANVAVETKNDAIARPTREEAEAAVRTLIAWTGADPPRDGRLDTPRRVVRCYDALYSGYK